MIQQPFREMTHEEERADILAMVGPGRYILVVPKDLREAALAHYGFAPEDVPGLIAAGPLPAFTHEQQLPAQFSAMPQAPHLGARSLPYPPHKKGRYAR